MSDVSCVQVGSELKTLEKLLCTEYETIRFDKRQNTSLRTDLYIHFLRLSLLLFSLRRSVWRFIGRWRWLRLWTCLRFVIALRMIEWYTWMWFVFVHKTIGFCSEHPWEICSCDAWLCSTFPRRPRNDELGPEFSVWWWWCVFMLIAVSFCNLPPNVCNWIENVFWRLRRPNIKAVTSALSGSFLSLASLPSCGTAPPDWYGAYGNDILELGLSAILGRNWLARKINFY